LKESKAAAHEWCTPPDPHISSKALSVASNSAGIQLEVFEQPAETRLALKTWLQLQNADIFTDDEFIRGDIHCPSWPTVFKQGVIFEEQVVL
jgi:hypothetical protein